MRQSDLSATPPPRPEAALTRGTTLGRFVVLGLVGRGAMGEVYGAYDPELDRKIAIKLVRARVDLGGDTSEGRTRLMREAQATAKISHPNVVVVYDAGTFGERVFIAMEFVEGHTLRYWLQERARPWQEILDAFLAAGRGLAAAHDKELVHRDFKPDNVMVASGGQVRVMDFGLARIADAGASSPQEPPRDGAGRFARDAAGLSFDLEATPVLGGPPVSDALATGTTTLAFRDKITATGALLGTPAYMSPEQFQGRPADARSDQFSYCVALYEALFGTRPFSGRTLEELAQNVVSGNVVEPPAAQRVPARIRRTLERGLLANPQDRFAAMNVLIVELEKGAGAGRGGFAAQAATKLAGVWEAPVSGQPVSAHEKEAIREAFLATGKVYAPASFVSASATLDRYAQRWSELYVEVCEATHVRGEQSAEILDLRMAFLTDGLDDLRALCRLFREATPEVVANADKAASALGNLERCQDVAFVRNLVRPPQDFQTRATVEALRARLVEVRAIFRVGRVTNALEAVAPLVDDARQVGYGPILAEALLMRGTLEDQSARPELAVQSLQEAFSEAQIARHDEAAAEAAIILMSIEGYGRSRFDGAEVWARSAEALLRRMGSHDRLWGSFFHCRASVREAEGRLAESLDDARRAVEAKTRAFGPRSFDVALSISNLGNHLAHGGDFEGALEANGEARAIFSASASSDHPWVAIALANQGQFLYRLGRYEEAAEVSARALASVERETDPRGIMVTFPLRALGLSYLGMGRFDAALEVLGRAVTIRDAIEKNPLRLAEVHFPYARALYETGARDRALAIARQARGEYERAVKTPVAEKDRAELDLWLAAHSKPGRVAGGPTRTTRGARPRPRRASRAGRRPS